MNGASVEVKGTDLLWPPTPMEVADVFQVLASQPRLHCGTGGGGGGGGKGKRPALAVIDPATAASLSSPAKKRKQHQPQQEEARYVTIAKGDTAKSAASPPSAAGGNAELAGQKGMCLLAAAAAGRALEEAQRDREKGKRGSSQRSGAPSYQHGEEASA